MAHILLALPSVYAVIEARGQNFADLLVANGLARIYGKRITLPDGKDSKQYREDLEKLGAKAKLKKAGGWAF